MVFDNLKEAIREKSLKGCVKAELKGEVVYFKKPKFWLTRMFGDWKRVYPPVNEDDTWNLPNLIFGGWKNLTRLIVIFIFLTIMFMAFHELFGQLEHLRTNACEVCSQMTEKALNKLSL